MKGLLSDVAREGLTALAIGGEWPGIILLYVRYNIWRVGASDGMKEQKFQQLH